MKRLAALSWLLLLLGLSTAKAQDRVGVGIILGEPTGISAKLWRDNTIAYDLALGWHTSGDDKLHLHGDYLIHDDSLINAQGLDGRMPVYYGAGLLVKRSEKNSRRDDRLETIVAVRVPVGVSYQANRFPVEFFAELVPSLALIPDSDFDLDIAIGGRYYFQ